MSTRKIVVIACSVLKDVLGLRLSTETPVTWLDITLHNTPKKLAASLQQCIDEIVEPSHILLGYGLCGNGLVGVKSRAHTLMIPRMHDCVAMFLGSHQRYVQRFFASPNTYYLTKGWIDAKDEPFTDYLDYVRDYDEETADYLVNMKYEHYRKLCLIGFSQKELDVVRPDAMKIAVFCKERFGMEYEETIGTTQLIDDLLRISYEGVDHSNEFVVIAPGGEIVAEMFMRPGEGAPPVAVRKEA
ncbi:MAG: DUF1638 domain-containing protein [Burkholderiales bacterium]